MLKYKWPKKRKQVRESNFLSELDEGTKDMST